MKRTPLKKISKKGIEKKKLKTENTKKLHEFFKEIWNIRAHYCQSCNKWLTDEPKSYMFDHLLEKAIYKELAMEPSNIYICCFECHSLKTNGFPTMQHQIAILSAEERLITNEEATEIKEHNFYEG